MAASAILEWLGTRRSDRRPWKKVSSLVQAFGAKRITTALKHRISMALRERGIELTPSLDYLESDDTVSFCISGANSADHVAGSEIERLSVHLPNQIITWDVINMGDGGSEGQWLRCLKSTHPGDRQFIWEGSSSRGIVGVVTYSGEMRNEGVYEGWGSFLPFAAPVSRRQLLGDARTANRFGERGIKGLQGSSIRLTEEESEAIVEMLGGLAPSAIPMDDPDYEAEVYGWFRRNGLPAEKFAEDAICQLPHLWETMGLTHPPKQQVVWNSIGRLDLLSGRTVIEVKKSVTADIGPDQIERYLGFLTKQKRIGPKDVRGILVQKTMQAAPGVENRLNMSPYPLELWSVDTDEDGEWEAIRIL
jgi:hypothetical protein